MKNFSFVPCLLVVAFAFGGAAPALAQSNDLTPILDRLQRLERDVKTLNIQVSRGGGAGGEEMGGTVAARIAVRLADLEDELRATTGRVETISNQISEIGGRLDKLIVDLDYRLSALEGRGGTNLAAQPLAPNVVAVPSPPGVQKALPGANQPGVLGTIPASDVPPPPVNKEEPQTSAASATEQRGETPVSAENLAPAPAQPAGILPQGTVKERYNFAFDLLRKADYDQAEIALTEFLQAHPDDQLSGNARYWLAESFYVRGQYVKAAEAFVAGYQADPTGPKAPDLLLKLGMSMSNLEKKQEACASFGKLLSDFPKASARILTKVEFESQKIGCE